MTRLRDLDGHFVRYEERQVDGRLRVCHVHVETLAEADGVFFLCPKCFAANGGRRGTHGVLCWFVGKVPGDVEPKPGRWNPSGTGLDDLTFVEPGAFSVLLTGAEGCKWHGYVSKGDAA